MDVRMIVFDCGLESLLGMRRVLLLRKITRSLFFYVDLGLVGGIFRELIFKGVSLLGLIIIHFIILCEMIRRGLVGGFLVRVLVEYT
jgi:hypothetical protein|tara:strand:+ start:982 stop:1242 length:261 start_codon:yes stop_codon:yes gene_type:complete